jgi:NtrC-family two-component system response regulator AlgB
MEQYRWPGNLRELRNVIERAVILAGGELIESDDLPQRLNQPVMESAFGVEIGARVSLEEVENEHIRRVLDRSATLDEAAQVLGIDPATLYRKRKKLAI